VHVQATTFPAFGDSGTAAGGQVTFLRKAQLLVADLYLRFHQEYYLFDFADMHALAGDSGAYAVAQLRARGCIECTQALTSSIASGEEIQAGLRERALRSAAVIACRALADELGVQEWQVSRWLQNQLDKDDDLGVVVHLTTQTVAY
jgi:hypothetical protein